MLHERSRIRRILHRQRREFQRRRPAFGSLEEPAELRIGQVAPEAVMAEARDLVGIELHLMEVDLEQLAPHAQSGQAQARLLARADHELHVARRVVDEPVDGVEHVGLAHALQVVEEQHDAALRLREVARERLQQGLAARGDVAPGPHALDGLADPFVPAV